MTWRQRLGWFLFLAPPSVAYTALLIVFCSFFGAAGFAVAMVATGIVLAGLAMVMA